MKGENVHTGMCVCVCVYPQLYSHAALQAEYKSQMWL